MNVQKLENILFLEPKSPHLHVYSRAYIPRIGSLLLGTILREAGYNIKIILEELEPIDEQSILDADVVCVSALTSTAPRSYDYCDFARQNGKVVIMGGTHPSFVPEEALQHADYVIREEGEKALPELLECLKNRGDLGKVPNLSWKDEAGNVISNRALPKLPNLDVIPIPDFSFVSKKLSVFSIQTQRGCPFDCSFCTVTAFNGHILRGHSVERVLQMVEHYRNKFDPKHLFYADDIFNLPPQRTKQILKGMIERGLVMSWSSQMRHEVSRDPELLDLMKKSGCIRMMIGFESINQASLELYGKKETIKDVEKAIAAIHGVGIDIHGMFISGAPTDTADDIKKTVEFARAQKLATMQLMILTHLPGSHDFIDFTTSGSSFYTNDWSHFDGHHANHPHPTMSRYELVNKTMGTMRAFYSWGGILSRTALSLKNLLLSRSDEVKRELLTTVLRWNGHALIRDWFRQNRGYLRKIKAEGHEPIPVKFNRVLLAVQDGKVKVALKNFLHGINIKVELLETHMTDQLHDIKRQFDLVVVDHETFEKFKQSLRNQRVLVLEKKNKLVRRTYFRLGLIFTENLQRIEAAYKKAMEPNVTV